MSRVIITVQVHPEHGTLTYRTYSGRATAHDGLVDGCFHLNANERYPDARYGERNLTDEEIAVLRLQGTICNVET